MNPVSVVCINMYKDDSLLKSQKCLITNFCNLKVRDFKTFDK
jgi:hypothetical protein